MRVGRQELRHRGGLSPVSDDGEGGRAESRRRRSTGRAIIRRREPGERYVTRTAAAALQAGDHGGAISIRAGPDDGGPGDLAVVVRRRRVSPRDYGDGSAVAADSRRAGRHVYGGRLVAERRSHGTHDSRAVGGTGCALEHRPAGPRPALAQQSVASMVSRVRTVSHAMGTIASAAINGIVIDEQESPLAGAMVSVLGAATAAMTRDRRERPFFGPEAPAGRLFGARAPHRVQCVAARECPPRCRRTGDVPAAVAPPRRAGRDDRRRGRARGPRRSSPPASACPPQSPRQTPSRATTITLTPIPRGGCVISRAAS